MAKCSCDLTAADLKHRATLQSVRRTEDGQGGFSEEWVDETSLWMKIEPLKGWEKMQAMQLQTPITHKITLRYRSGVTTAKRLRWGSRILQVKESINIDEANKWLRVMAVETEGMPTALNDYLFQDGTAKNFQDGIGFQFQGTVFESDDDYFAMQDGGQFVFQDGINFKFM